MRRAAAVLVPVVVLLAAAPAQAKWVRAERVAGPRSIVRIGGAALGPDGTGAVTYVARADRGRAGFLVRLRGGAWQRRVRLSGGAVRDVEVAAGSDGRLAL